MLAESLLKLIYNATSISNFLNSLFSFGFYSLPPFIILISFIINIFIYKSYLKTNKNSRVFIMFILLLLTQFGILLSMIPYQILSII